MQSKTIIISSERDNSKRGILTLFQDEELLKCRLRTYNLQPLNRFCKLGIYHEKEVYSANLIERNGVYESSFVGDFNMEKDFYTALIDMQNNNEVLLSGGTYQGYYFNDNSVFLKSDNESESAKTGSENLEDETAEHQCDNCAKCKYKEFFYSNQNMMNADDKQCQTEAISVDEIGKPNINQIEQTKCEISENNEECENENQQNNLEMASSLILPQFEQLFKTCNLDSELNQLLENSKFVKLEENGEQYSIGAIYENDEIKFVCYAVKSEYNLKPPKELGDNCQWLPIDKEDPLSSGYFIVFQDVKDFKIVKI